MFPPLVRVRPLIYEWIAQALLLDASMLSKLLIALSAAAVSAGSIEMMSNLGSSGLELADNFKGKWSQAVKLFGASSTLSAEYDRSQSKDALSEVSAAGKSGAVDYKLTLKSKESADFEVSTATTDGTTLGAEGSVSPMSSKLSLSKVSAARSVNLREQDYDLELAHDLTSSKSELKLSTNLGSGVKASGTITTQGGASSTAYEVGYDTTLTEGRTLSATLNPADGTGEVEYEDSASLEAATITATLPLGGSPKLRVKRGFSF